MTLFCWLDRDPFFLPFKPGKFNTASLFLEGFPLFLKDLHQGKNPFFYSFLD